MKRRITSLEEKLIENGYTLNLKRYTGKHCDKTLCYEYVKDAGHTLVILLNYKRDKVIKFGVANVHIDLVDGEYMKALHNAFFDLKKFVGSLEDKPIEFKIPPELLESVE